MCSKRDPLNETPPHSKACMWSPSSGTTQLPVYALPGLPSAPHRPDPTVGPRRSPKCICGTHSRGCPDPHVRLLRWNETKLMRTPATQKDDPVPHRFGDHCAA